MSLSSVIFSISNNSLSKEKMHTLYVIILSHAYSHLSPFSGFMRKMLTVCAQKANVCFVYEILVFLLWKKHKDFYNYS